MLEGVYHDTHYYIEKWKNKTRGKRIVKKEKITNGNNDG